MLRDFAIRKAAPAEKPYKMMDGGGLYLFIKPNGSKLWRMRYHYGGKEKTLSFGMYPDVSIAEARDRRSAAKGAIRAGRDPGVDEPKSAKTSDTTFEKVAREWFGIQKPKWSDHHAKNVIDSLEIDVFPKIGGMGFAEITASVVLHDVLRPIEDRGAIETARRVRQRISMIFIYAIALGIAENDPAAPLTHAMRPVIKSKFPAVVELEPLRAMLRHLESIPTFPTTKLANRLLAITAVRPGTLLETPWSEFGAINPSEPIWRIPPHRLKLFKKHKTDPTREHWVPLPPQALEIIEVLRRLTGRGPYVFPNQSKPHEPVPEGTLERLLKRNGYRDRHVPHGYRSSFSTIMNEWVERRGTGGADRAIIDVMLAHVNDDEVEGSYNRAAYLPRRIELARIWADMLLDGFAPAETLAIGKRRSPPRRPAVDDSASTP